MPLCKRDCGRRAPRGKQLCADCAKLCPRCNANPLNNYRWCDPCRAAYERQRRANRVTLTKSAFRLLLDGL